jgi:single-strand DNA-binding protein
MKTISNSVQLIGNLGKDPEIKQFEGGKKLGRVSLATSETYKNAKGEWITETQWHNLVAWGKQAETLERIAKKGTALSVKGKLVNRNYEDKEGIKRYLTEIVIYELEVPEKKPSENASEVTQ